MNASVDAASGLGQVFVQTTNNRGHTVEEIAERAANRILRVDSKEALNHWLVKYLREAQEAERQMIRKKLTQQGYSEIAHLIGDL
jgi:histone acetyltransferase (RNA polymerase elongator complex component)